MIYAFKLQTTTSPQSRNKSSRVIYDTAGPIITNISSDNLKAKEYHLSGRSRVDRPSEHNSEREAKAKKLTLKILLQCDKPCISECK